MDKQTGVYEWAAKPCNFQLGCKNNCRYCYAREMAVRYGRCTVDGWRYPIINHKKVNLSYKNKVEGGIMFPSTHDVTPLNLSEYLCVLHKLLDAGNQVLIVSKPNKKCIKEICNTMSAYKDQIMFRFTIGSMDDDVLKFWEPNAPDFTERIYSLRVAYDAGYATSVSCEPCLDIYPDYTYHACEKWVTDSIWIGKMRNIKTRVDMSKITDAEKSHYVGRLIAAQTDKMILSQVKLMKDRPLVRWKDSITKVIERHPEIIK